MAVDRAPTWRAVTRPAADILAVSVELETLAGVLDDLAARGFTEHLVPAAGGLRAVESGRGVAAREARISEYHRFEGVSDPDDMAIVYAIEAPGGVRGTLTDAFGVYADPRVAAFVAEAGGAAR